MTLEKKISKRLSKNEIQTIALKTLEEPKLLNEVIQLIWNTDKKTQFQALWILYDNCKSGKLILDIETIIRLEKYYLISEDESTQRMILSLLVFSPIPENINVSIINQCFDYALNPKIKPSIQSFSVKYLYKVGKREPELLNELKRGIQETDISVFSSGSRSILRRLLQNKKII